MPQVDVRGFWGDRVDAVASRTADILYQRCVDAGMLDQIDPDRPPPGVRIPFHVGEGFTARTVTTQMFWDSDIGKTIETAAYSLYRKPNPALEAKIDAIVDMYAKLQQEDGYLSSWYQRIQPGLRWTNLRDCHELYCAGHLIEGAVAYFQATGKRKLLDVMCRYADHIGAMFGPEPEQAQGLLRPRGNRTGAGEARARHGERKYLDLAKYFIDERGRSPHYFDQEARARGADPKDFHFKTYEYNQSHKPVREQDKVVGHAVRAMYLYSGMADIATEYGDESLRVALDRLWDDLNAKNLYVTGGLGPSKQNEGFTCDYDLPNEIGLCRDLRGGRAGVLVEPDARHGSERALRRRDGAGALQRLDLRPFAATDRCSSMKIRCAAAAITIVGSGIAAPAVRPMSGAWSRRSAATCMGVADDAIAVHLYGDSSARFEIGGRAGAPDADQSLSLGWRRRDHVRDGDADALRRLSAHSRLEPLGVFAGQWRADRSGRLSRATATPWSSANGEPATPCGWSSRWRSSASRAPGRRGR